MESKTRLVTKAMTWQIAGFFSMTIIGFFFTGSVTAGGGIAIVASVAGFASYFAHELVWSKVAWGVKGRQQ